MISAYEGNVQIAWDATSLARFETCARYYYYSNIVGYRSKKTSIHLTFGVHYHKALENYTALRLRLADHKTALTQTLRQLLIDSKSFESEDSYKNREILFRTVFDYLEHYQHDNLKTVVLNNGLAATELSFRFELDSSTMLCGHMDRIVEYNEQFYTMDHKTTKSAIGSQYFDQYSVSVQMPLYTLAGQVVYNVPTKGILIDAVQILVSGTRFGRAPIPFGKAWLDEWLEITKHKIALAKQYAKADYWPMNRTACHNYGGCPFRRVCSRSPEVRQMFLDADFIIDRWDPLIPRNVEE